MTQSLWDIAVQQNHSKKNKSEQPESTLLFYGNSGSGKSTLIHSLLEKEDKPKPTLALDFTFGRKKGGNYLSRGVSYIWELGSGTKLSDLIDVAITPANILTLHCILVLDLSKPNELWYVLETLLKATQTRIEQILNRMKQRDIMHIQADLRKKQQDRISSNHSDKELLSPFAVPLIIIGTKYDLLMIQQSEQQKLICKALRFISHYYNASLYFLSTKDDANFKKVKLVLNQIAFGGTEASCFQPDTGKALSISCGMDSFSNIGTPPNIDGKMCYINSKTPWDMWKSVFISTFPQTFSDTFYANFGDTKDPVKDPQFAEPLVDKARKTKDEKLELNRRQSEKRMHVLLQQVTADGLLIA